MVGAVSGEDVQKALRVRVADFETLQNELKQRFRAYLDGRLEEEVWATLRERVPAFSTWYFDYGTTYKVMGRALQSALWHAAAPGSRFEGGVRELVAADLAKFFETQYELIVLRPEITDFKFKQALSRIFPGFMAAEVEAGVKDVEARFLQRIAAHMLEDRGKLAVESSDENQAGASVDENSEFRGRRSSPARGSVGAASSAEHLRKPLDEKTPSAARAFDLEFDLTLDWDAQLRKIKSVPATFTKTPEVSVGLMAVGAFSGKAAAGAAGKVAAAGAVATTSKAGAAAVGGAGAAAAKGAGTMTGKAAASKLFTTFVGKLTGPFLGKLSAALAALGGPLGLLAGVSVDYLLNKGVALVQRAEFERDMNEILDATKAEWVAVLGDEMDVAVAELITSLQQESWTAPG